VTTEDGFLGRPCLLLSAQHAMQVFQPVDDDVLGCQEFVKLRSGSLQVSRIAILHQRLRKFMNVPMQAIHLAESL